MTICPRCEREYDGYPALSRRDSKTEICPDCWKEEALIDWGVPKKGRLSLTGMTETGALWREVAFMRKLAK